MQPRPGVFFQKGKGPCETKTLNWQVVLGIVLVVLSAIVYTIRYFLFHDAHHLFMFLVGDIGFVFIEVLLVTMILHKLLEVREKRAKLNMVVGSFFSETGTELLGLLSGFDREVEATRDRFAASDSWNGADFARARRDAERVTFRIDASRADLTAIRDHLERKRDSVLRILENPNILEYERFTDVLWGGFHLGEELGHRQDLKNLSEADLGHLGGDIERAYTRLTCEWLAYMAHLKQDYPYLDSLARRLSPFDPQAKAEIS
ncbi:hypothetical protein [uncultured Desulfuromonas sp.]|uniref:hypothetical protein n=1 Tax=uncultured Desulfuromonas sp. TaxID=181013 RepID=UPI002611D396|nr:hypothetical protein [uncultured Desulfuromonas sp.]